MTRNDFLSGIRAETGFMLPERRRETVAHFAGILSTVRDEDIASKLGTPKEALERYLDPPIPRMCLPLKILTASAAMVAAPILIDAAVITALVLIAAAVIIAALPFAGALLWMLGISGTIRAFFDIQSIGLLLCRAGTGLIISGAGIFILVFVFIFYRKFLSLLFGKLYAALTSLTDRCGRIFRRII